MLDIDPNRKILLLFGMHIAEYKWLDRLPVSVVICDLYQLVDGASDDVIDLVTLRVIQTFAQSARIFIKSSPYGYRFYERFGSILHDNPAVMLRFCDGTFEVGSSAFSTGFDFRFLAEQGEALSVILTDNQFILDADQARLPFLRGKAKVIYSTATVSSETTEIPHRYAKLHDRIIWASRLDHQKRPELLAPLARAMHENFPNVVFEIWGTSVLNTVDTAELERQPNVELKGEFSSFDDINYDEADLFLYTSRFDGIPTILLHALGAGLPVIAPSMGGIPEVVIDNQTGLLVDPSQADEDLVAAYISAIRRLRKSKETRIAMGENAIRLIEKRHSCNAHTESIRMALFS